MSRRRIVPMLAVAASSALVLAGCQSAGVETPDDPVDLRMAIWSTNEQHLALFDEIADEYIAANPDLVDSIVFESTPAADYPSALRTQIAGGDAPDIAWIHEVDAIEFVQSGALLDLNDVFDADEDYELGDIIPASLELWRDGESLYAFPFSNSPFAVFVNRDLIAAAGADDPVELFEEGAWTWDSAREIGAAVAGSTDSAGLVIRDFEYREWNRLSQIWASWGAEPWSEDGTECTLDDPAMVDAMTWIHDAIFVDHAMPTPGTTSDFFAGQAAMTVTQISRASAIDGSFDWDILPLPAGPNGSVGVIGQAGVGVFADGPNAEIAADFLKFFTSPENAERLAQFFPSPRESSLTPETLAAANATLSAEQLERVVVDVVPGAVTMPSHANAGEVLERGRVALDDLWVADANVEAVLTATCGALTPALGG